MTIDEILASIEEKRSRIKEIDGQYAGRLLEPESADGEEWNRLNEEVEEEKRTVKQLRERAQRVSELYEEPANREGAGELSTFNTGRSGVARGDDVWDLSTVKRDLNNPQGATRELRDRAMRAIEVSRFPHERANREEVQGHLESLLERHETEDGQIAQHLLRTGSDVYKRAFGRALMGEMLSNEERAALAIGAVGTGGAAVPYQLDPTIIPTSNSSVNPFRAISRVEPIVGTNEWRAVTSGDVTARYSQEAAEVGGSGSGDDAPTLAQPAIIAERADSFIRFSREVSQDWGSMQAELAKLLQEAKDNLEADKFLTGLGHTTYFEPQGVLVGATTTVETAAANAFGVSDIYAVEEALGSRFRQPAVWVANRSIFNKVRQFDSAGGASLWKRLADPTTANGQAGDLAGYPAYEASEMDSTVTAGNLIAILGDFAHYCIVDRIGLAVEIVPHLFGTNQKPTGQSGFLAIWRNSAEVLTPNAFRVLEVAAPGSGSGS